ncbi:MAG: PfkB family carbohydrate kinase, partial [Candidatus Limnocylindrales bacterium]
MTGRLVVIGSLNVDLVVAGVPLPRPGQTVTGGHLETHQGGKGGNAAVAAARALRAGPAEGRVGLAGAVGDDPHGQAALDA